MEEQILEDFFLGKIDSAQFLGLAFKKQTFKNGDFLITKGHLTRLSDLALQGEITPQRLEFIADSLVFSDYFSWDNESTGGAIVSQTIFEWGNPSINYEINNLNLRLWREYLQTGEHKLGYYNDWNAHIKTQKEICKKVNSEWQPVNPKQKIGVSGNLDCEPVHGLRHPTKKGTTGWYIWTGEYSPADDFFKPIHAEHLLHPS